MVFEGSILKRALTKQSLRPDFAAHSRKLFLFARSVATFQPKMPVKGMSIMLLYLLRPLDPNNAPRGQYRLKRRSTIKSGHPTEFIVPYSLLTLNTTCGEKHLPEGNRKKRNRPFVR